MLKTFNRSVRNKVNINIETIATPVKENASNNPIIVKKMMMKFKNFDLINGFNFFIPGIKANVIVMPLNAPSADGSEKNEVALKKLSNLRLSCDNSSTSFIFLLKKDALVRLNHAKGRSNALAII
ncbi:hypothetical protein MASR1M45_08290 [Candidatus Kapaibacterium sp.]